MALHSIVIPVFNEETGLDALFKRMQKLLTMIPEPVEVILVNDGSHDRTAAILDELHVMDARFKVIHFSRNFGHQIAITAGTDRASGNTVTVMDADLQDPPEVILDFIAKWKEGFDVVYGIRRTRQGESKFKLWTAKIFYRLIRKLTGLAMPVDTGDFRLMDRKVVDALAQLREHHRYVRGLVSWVGFKQTGVFYDRKARHAGYTHYSLKKMLRLAFDGITSFSLLPLKLATYFGFMAMVLALVTGSVLIYEWLTSSPTVTAVVLPILFFLSGVQLLGIGLLGEYIGRVFDETKKRPLYFVSSMKGFEATGQSAHDHRAA